MQKTVKLQVRVRRGVALIRHTVIVDTRENEQFRRVGVLRTIEREAITEGDRRRAQAAEELRSYELHRYRRPAQPGAAKAAG